MQPGNTRGCQICGCLVLACNSSGQEVRTGRAQVEQDALAAQRPGRFADLASVLNELHVELVAELGSDSRLEQSVSLLGRRLLRDQTEASCYSVYVCVDRKRVAAHREDKHAGSRLRSYSGKRYEVALHLLIVEFVESAEVDPPLSFFDLTEDSLDANRLRVRETSRANGVGHLRRIRVSDGVPIGEALLESAKGARRVHVRRVLAQHRHHQLVHDGELRFASKRALLAQQPAMKRARSASIDHL